MLDIDEQRHEIIYGYRFPNWFDRLIGRTKEYCYRPSWYKYFDSFEVDDLPEFSYVEWDSSPACENVPTERENTSEFDGIFEEFES